MIMTLGVMAFAAAFMLASSTAAYADIPAWVRDVAGLWSEGSIDDDTYLNTITWLVDHGFIVLPSDDTHAQQVPQDTASPAITPPTDISANATGILTALPNLGEASATDAVGGLPVITNDAPDLFPIGTTTITWNATDSSGNWAAATQLVAVSEGELDSDWHYVLRWHEGHWGHAAITLTKSFDSLLIAPSDVGYGDAYLFKTFRTGDIRDHNITIKSDASSPHNVTISVLDGAYSKHVP